MATINTNTNKLHVNWSDSSFFPWLNPNTALDYFCNTSNPFYNHNCNNEELRMQNVDPKQLVYMTGHEYQLYLSEPPLYIVRKVDRKSQTEVNELAYFYILSGIVYQSPDFLSVVSSRLQTSISHLQDAIETIFSAYKYHPSKGYYWNFNTSELNKKESKLRSNNQFQRVDLLLNEFTNKFLPSKQNTNNNNTTAQQPQQANAPPLSSAQQAQPDKKEAAAESMIIDIKSENSSPAAAAPPEKKMRIK